MLKNKIGILLLLILIIGLIIYIVENSKIKNYNKNN